MRGSGPLMGRDDRPRSPNLRYFPGQRWLNIGLRSLHLLGVAGMGAGFLAAGAAGNVWHHYLWLTLATGLAMTLIEAWSDRRWLAQLCGQAVLVKLLLLGLIPLWPAAGPGLFTAVILLSAVISHAPAKLRHYAPLSGPGSRQRKADRTCGQ